MHASRTIEADKIASLAESLNLGRELRLSDDILCEEGVLVAVRIQNNKSRYNTLELTSGRMAVLKEGDVIVGALGHHQRHSLVGAHREWLALAELPALNERGFSGEAGALGHRKALFGYSGSLPSELKRGDIIQLLNIGGVMGHCDSANPELGVPFDCEVLGMVLDFPYLGERIGVAARAGETELPDAPALDVKDTPVVALAGTCMDYGKPAAACAIVSRLRARGLTVAACKATGVALRRDILAMEDAGATESMLFSDFGVMTTTRENGPALTRSLLTQLSNEKPDVIVMELGDGLLGTYGVDAILADTAVRAAASAVASLQAVEGREHAVLLGQAHTDLDLVVRAIGRIRIEKDAARDKLHHAAHCGDIGTVAACFLHIHVDLPIDAGEREAVLDQNQAGRRFKLRAREVYRLCKRFEVVASDA